jgi:hypothetical protein
MTLNKIALIQHRILAALALRAVSSSISYIDAMPSGIPLSRRKPSADWLLITSLAEKRTRNCS